LVDILTDENKTCLGVGYQGITRVVVAQYEMILLKWILLTNNKHNSWMAKSSPSTKKPMFQQ